MTAKLRGKVFARRRLVEVRSGIPPGTDHAVSEKILGHLGLPTEAPTAVPAKVAGWLPGVEPPPTGITE